MIIEGFRESVLAPHPITECYTLAQSPEDIAFLLAVQRSKVVFLRAIDLTSRLRHFDPTLRLWAVTLSNAIEKNEVLVQNNSRRRDVQELTAAPVLQQITSTETPTISVPSTLAEKFAEDYLQQMRKIITEGSSAINQAVRYIGRLPRPHQYISPEQVQGLYELFEAGVTRRGIPITDSSVLPAPTIIQRQLSALPFPDRRWTTSPLGLPTPTHDKKAFLRFSNLTQKAH